MTDKPERSDVLILGAGPAGAAAACAAAKRGLTVAVVEQARRGGTTLAAEWLHPNATPILDRWGITTRDLSVGKIKHVRFIDVQNRREIAADMETAVEVIDASALLDALLNAAEGFGAELHFGWQASSIDVGEGGVTLSNGKGASLEGRLLVAANGCYSVAIEKVAGTAGHARGISAHCVQVMCEGATPAEADCLTVLLESNDMSQFGYVHEAQGGLCLGFVANLPRDETAAAFLAAHARWLEKKHVPATNVKPSGIQVRPIARGLALDRDSQVGKNTLAIGDAGGFVASISHEGLYPAIQSAALAIEIAARAVSSPHPQDALMEYDAAWRSELVDHLRMPNADLRFLLPLVFTNERMAAKMAEALLFGKNI